ncbi:AraC family transcriptional regulator [Amycolatopsis pithecellobii]|uniref:AraC family transcriptional regulator n=1 Tax=Amycolatopsis pithecellobii TaxID=664692 RepID=UPI001408A2CB|nr:AraC family transcriptional regulator [Amycolatopsis pithecellobii]
MSGSILPPDVARRLVLIGERQGLDVASLLRRTGISAGTRPGEVTVAQAAELTQELWCLTGDELFGLGPPVPLHSFRLVMRSVLHAPDLRAALHRVVEACQVLSTLPRVRVSAEETEVEVELDVSRLNDPEHLAAELVAMLIHRVLGWLAGRRIGLRRLELPWPAPPSAAAYGTVFGRQPRFGGARLVLAFDQALLDAPVIRDEKELDDYLADQPNVWFVTRDYGSSAADRVRRILEHGLRGQWPTPDEIGSRLSVSPQHLRRLLRAEHTSIGQIKEDLVRDAAIASLTRGEESVEELARRLGFSEASSFRRAFRRWTGQPPGAYRRRPVAASG